jgi:hypothetical protein
MTLPAEILRLRPPPEPVHTFANAEATALVGRMTTAPNYYRKRLIDETIGGLKADGLWAKLDCLYLCAAHDQQAAKLNWKMALFDLADPGATAPAFAANGGFTGDGVTDYLDSTFTPGLSGGVYAQNNCQMWEWVGNDVSATAQIDLGNASAQICARSATFVRTRGQSSSNSQSTLPANTSIGMAAWSRNNSANFDVFKNGALIENKVQASSVLVSTPFYLLAQAGVGPAPVSFSARQIRAAGWGSALTAPEMTNLYNRLATYMAGL